jgi:hypothetical protein
VAFDGQRKGDGGVDVRAADAADAAGDVDAEGDRQRPPPGDQQPVAAGREDLRAAPGLVECGHRHGDHPVTEGDQHQRAEELGQQPLPRPCAESGRS